MIVDKAIIICFRRSGTVARANYCKTKPLVMREVIYCDAFENCLH